MRRRASSWTAILRSMRKRSAWPRAMRHAAPASMRCASTATNPSSRHGSPCWPARPAVARSARTITSNASNAIIIGLLLVNLAGLLVIGIRVGLLGGDDRKLDRRLTMLEVRVENLPTHRDLSMLRNDIAEVVESVAGLS